jgi:taurine transport system permease protein
LIPVTSAKRRQNESRSAYRHQRVFGGGFFRVWQLAATRQWVDPLLLPSLTDIGLTAEELLADGYRQVPLWQHVAVSLARALSAFAVAIVLGIPLGLLMGLSPGLSAVLNPFVQFLRPLPKIALIPLAVVWLGIGKRRNSS